MDFGGIFRSAMRGGDGTEVKLQDVYKKETDEKGATIITQKANIEGRMYTIQLSYPPGKYPPNATEIQKKLQSTINKTAAVVKGLGGAEGVGVITFTGDKVSIGDNVNSLNEIGSFTKKAFLASKGFDESSADNINKVFKGNIDIRGYIGEAGSGDKGLLGRLTDKFRPKDAETKTENRTNDPELEIDAVVSERVSASVIPDDQRRQLEESEELSTRDERDDVDAEAMHLANTVPSEEVVHDIETILTEVPREIPQHGISTEEDNPSQSLQSSKEGDVALPPPPPPRDYEDVPLPPPPPPQQARTSEKPLFQTEASTVEPQLPQQSINTSEKPEMAVTTQEEKNSFRDKLETYKKQDANFSSDILKPGVPLDFIKRGNLDLREVDLEARINKDQRELDETARELGLSNEKGTNINTILNHRNFSKLDEIEQEYIQARARNLEVQKLELAYVKAKINEIKQ